jgi:hypothetical protein
MELINNQREDLLRNNEKFMKEVKRKRDEELKLLIDKSESKKEKAAAPKVPEPKKEE